MVKTLILAIFLTLEFRGSNDAFNEYYTASTTQDLSSVDLKQMDVLGYHLSGSTVVASTVTGSPMISQSVVGFSLTPELWLLRCYGPGGPADWNGTEGHLQFPQ
jgi:hypothetical protein